MNHSREIYKGRAIHLFVASVSLPNGAVAELDTIRHPGASAVVPLRDDGQVILIHPYRHSAGRYTQTNRVCETIPKEMRRSDGSEGV